jgi:hypothetical protein
LMEPTLGAWAAVNGWPTALVSMGPLQLGERSATVGMLLASMHRVTESPASGPLVLTLHPPALSGALITPQVYLDGQGGPRR